MDARSAAAALADVVVATVLPFNEDETIDWPSFGRLLDYVTGAGDAPIRTVFVNGHAGEGAALTRAERISVLRFARAHLGSGCHLIAGVIAQSSAEAIAEAQVAHAAGADSLTLFPPSCFGGARTEMVVSYVSAVAAAVPLPLTLFQYPIASGYGYSTATLLALSALPQVAAIKEGSDSMRAYEENWAAVKAARPDMRILASNFDWFLAQIAVGSDGILSGLASLAPRELSALWQAGCRGDLAVMRAVSARMTPLVRAIYATPRNEMYARIKLALKMLGIIDHATARAPFVALDMASARSIAAAVSAMEWEGLQPAPGSGA